jgi:hypothetical protein
MQLKSFLVWLCQEHASYNTSRDRTTRSAQTGLSLVLRAIQQYQVHVHNTDIKGKRPLTPLSRPSVLRLSVGSSLDKFEMEFVHVGKSSSTQAQAEIKRSLTNTDVVFYFHGDGDRDEQQSRSKEKKKERQGKPQPPPRAFSSTFCLRVGRLVVVLAETIARLATTQGRLSETQKQCHTRLLVAAERMLHSSRHDMHHHHHHHQEEKTTIGPRSYSHTWYCVVQGLHNLLATPTVDRVEALQRHWDMIIGFVESVFQMWPLAPKTLTQFVLACQYRLGAYRNVGTVARVHGSVGKPEPNPWYLYCESIVLGEGLLDDMKESHRMLSFLGTDPEQYATRNYEQFLTLLLQRAEQVGGCSGKVQSSDVSYLRLWVSREYSSANGGSGDKFSGIAVADLVLLRMHPPKLQGPVMCVIHTAFYHETEMFVRAGNSFVSTLGSTLTQLASDSGCAALAVLKGMTANEQYKRYFKQMYTQAGLVPFDTHQALANYFPRKVHSDIAFTRLYS